MALPFQDEFFDNMLNAKELLMALEKLPDSLFMIKDLNSKYIYMSEQLKKEILNPGIDIVGLTDFDLFPKLIAQTYQNNDREVFNSGKELVNEVHVMSFFKGKTKWMISSKFPLHDKEGNVMGLITVNEVYDKIAGKDDNLNRLTPAIDYISKNYSRQIVIADLAKECHLSETHFMRLFKQCMNMTAHSFIEQVRMHNAMDDICHSNKSISDIAQECGYYDQSAFIKRFKTFTGLTPLKYRKKQAEEQKLGKVTTLPSNAF